MIEELQQENERLKKENQELRELVTQLIAKFEAAEAETQQSEWGELRLLTRSIALCSLGERCCSAPRGLTRAPSRGW